MIAEIGHFALILSLAMAVLLSVLPLCNLITLGESDFDYEDGVNALNAAYVITGYNRISMKL